jgi:aspartyl-tRNA(Asn)/glutamyl-tRNA(Gln) amidotransferase subunit C
MLPWRQSNEHGGGFAVIDDRTVAHVAHLSRLELTDDERERFRAQLGGILEHFQSLMALDLSGERLPAEAPAVANVLRDDVVAPCLTREEALANAPASEDGFFVVPPVIEGE